DAAPTPAHKPGNALPPQSTPLLQQLGLLGLVQSAPHLPYHGNRVCWGSDSWEEKQFLKERYQTGFLLHRRTFEAQLRERVNQPTAVLRFGYRLHQLTPQGATTEVVLRTEERTETWQAQWVVDATGRKASVCRHWQVQPEPGDQQMAAFFEVPLSHSVEHAVHIEATEAGWWYLTPTLSGTADVMFFSLQESFRSSSEGLMIWLRQAWESSLYMQHLIDWPKQETAIQRMPAGTQALPQPYGEGWVAIGDAAYGFDPLSSYGITNALAGGFYAGNALADQLTGQRKDALTTYRYIAEQAFHAYGSELPLHYQNETRFPKSRYWTQRLTMEAG
ncbi:MAG TPA: NAD(P)/FAD-dependent oxidoreductase, partial [Cytophagales bacterium]|nr:NAD(P)/FAD-dependent oxidoreductase [Cytophagales bacterium]